jgi:hypothetical protein
LPCGQRGRQRDRGDVFDIDHALILYAIIGFLISEFPILIAPCLGASRCGLSREATKSLVLRWQLLANARTYRSRNWQGYSANLNRSYLSYRHDDPSLVNVKPDIRDTILHDPSSMQEARHRPVRRNPRYLHTARRVGSPHP